MTFRVRMRGSGHEFPIEPTETVLDAALRAGIYLDYGCNNGSCGDCRARRLDGELGFRQPHDFPLGEAARNDGWFLPCRTGAAGDLLIEAHEAGRPADIPAQQITAKVTRLERHGDGILIAHLRTPRSRTLRFLAGQRATLTLRDGSRATLPIASCPCNGMVLQFHLFNAAGDAFAQAAFATLKPGDPIDIAGPFGDFTLDDASPLAQLFVTYEAAFATTKSLVEHAISVDEDRPRHLIWLARDAQCHYLANLGRAWADSLDDFHFTPLLVGDDAWEPAFATVRDALHALGHAEVYVNGPDALLHAARAELPDTARLHLDLPS